jgi:hypothetical protein
MITHAIIFCQVHGDGKKTLPGVFLPLSLAHIPRVSVTNVSATHVSATHVSATHVSATHVFAAHVSATHVFAPSTCTCFSPFFWIKKGGRSPLSLCCHGTFFTAGAGKVVKKSTTQWRERCMAFTLCC